MSSTAGFVRGDVEVIKSRAARSIITMQMLMKADIMQLDRKFYFVFVRGAAENSDEFAA